MVVLQLINKILNESDINIIIENNLTKDMFVEYENEFSYIMDFFNNYGKVPDKETFLSNFPDFNLIEVHESDKFLLDKLNEEYLYFKMVPVVQEVAERLKVNSEDAVNYLSQQLPNLNSLQKTIGVDIINNANLRLDEFKNKLNNEETNYISTGFEELDYVFKGFSRRRRISCSIC